jgi:hypothetical protein
MRSALRTFFIGTLLTVSSAALAAPAASDPVIGTWTLNVAKSTGAVPKTDTRTYAAADGGIKLTMKRVSAEGKEISAQTNYKYDGKDYPFKGSSEYDTVSAKRIAPRTVEITQKLGGKVVGMTTRTVSPDGKTLTLATRSKNAKGEVVSSTLVFDRK